MRDRLGKAAFINLPIRNETQNVYRRFVRQPQAGLPDMLSDYKRGWDDIKNMALRSRVEEM